MTRSTAFSQEVGHCLRKVDAQLEPCLQAMHQQALWYTQYGLMAGSVFEEVLEDLRAAGLSQEAAVVDLIMFDRTAVGVTFQSSSPCPPKPGRPCWVHGRPPVSGHAHAGTGTNLQCLGGVCRHAPQRLFPVLSS